MSIYRSRHARTGGHVWLYGRKVTPFAGYNPRRYSWRWEHPQRAIERHHHVVLERCRRSGIPTQADPARSVVLLGSLSVYDHFRRVDKHGRTFGLRMRIVDWSFNDRVALVEDDRGREHFLTEQVRVRLVARQPEDPHSAACRALKAQWRLTRNDNT